MQGCNKRSLMTKMKREKKTPTIHVENEECVQYNGTSNHHNF